MKTAVNQNDDLKKTTKRQVLPYNFRFLLNGKLVIENTRGQTLIVTQDQVQRVLQCEDLDVHRRRMYEAALAEFENENEKAKVH